MRLPKDERVIQVAVGAAILIAIGLVVPGVLLGWGHLPGILGEWIGTIIGVMTTPFFMEASFVILGFVIVISINHWRRTKDGDDFVYLEQVDGPDAPETLPDQARWAIFRDKPLEAKRPTLIELAEGAFGIGDFVQTTEWIGLMGHDELKQPGTLALRLALAKATGRDDLLESLESEMQKACERQTLSI